MSHWELSFKFPFGAGLRKQKSLLDPRRRRVRDPWFDYYAGFVPVTSDAVSRVKRRGGYVSRFFFFLFLFLPTRVNCESRNTVIGGRGRAAWNERRGREGEWASGRKRRAGKDEGRDVGAKGHALRWGES